jgi:UDP-N-acetylglucosamine 2-epimerase
MEALMSALHELKMQTLLLWPNIDAGSDHISKVIRVYRARGEAPWMRTLTNLTPEHYLRVLAATACAVGNSSSFVRDAGYFGTPVVLVGNRQNGRETDEHVIRVPVDEAAIVATVKRQLEHGRYAPSTLYGDGHVAARIAEAIEKLTPYLQKQLAFTLTD